MTEGTRPAAAGKPAKAERKIKVVIIDPHPNFRDRIKSLVRQLPFVDAVSDRGSPQHILDLLAQNPADVIVIDREPGGGDVLEIIQAIRGKGVGARTGFVLVGDELDENVRARAAQRGVAGFVQRPYDLASVEAALLAAMGPAPDAPPADAKARDGLRETLEKLRKVSLFQRFSDSELVRLLKICRTRQYAAGTYVFREGDKGVSLFVLVAGKLEIRSQVDGEDHVLVEMSPGDCFGEMAIIDAEPRSADAVAATDCTVIEVNESVVNNNEDILSLKLVRQIAILLAKKLRALSHAKLR